MPLRHTRGDLLKLAADGAFDVIVHGCNCFCTMGAGIAKGIAAQFPEAYAADRHTAKGDRLKLGTCSFAAVQVNGRTLTVVNAYTQFDFRGSGMKADYAALRSCLRWVAETFPDARIGLPKIGAGLAGGDWATIEAIVTEELRDRAATIVEYQP